MMKNICLGDSLTASYHVRPEEGWVTLLGRETPDTWINAGVSGDTSAGMLARLLTEVFPQKPDRVLYMGGDNDILVTGSLDQAKSSLMSILHLCVDREIRPVIGIPIPILDVPQPWQAICDPKRRRRSPGSISTGCVSLPPRSPCGGWISRPRSAPRRSCGCCTCRTGCTQARWDTD